MSIRTPTSPAFPHQLSSSAASAGSSSGPNSMLATAVSHSAAASGIVRPGSGPGSRPNTPSTSAVGLQSQPDSPAISIEDVARWTSADIATWLHSLRLGSHVGTFESNDITGAVLLDVDQAALKEMGITSVGDRIRVFSAIKNLKKRCAESRAMALHHQQQQVLQQRAAAVAASAAAYSQARPAGQDSEMEYLDGTAAAGGRTPQQPGVRRTLHSRPPPLHLTSSAAHDMPKTPTAPSPVGNVHMGQGLGLREARGLTSSGQGRLGSSAAYGESGSGLLSHRKMGSYGGQAALVSPVRAVSAGQPRLGYSGGGGSVGVAGRPSTATGANTYGGPGSRYASNSPTSGTFAPHGGPTRPSTSDGARFGSSQQQQMIGPNGKPLTPITETAYNRGSPTTPSFQRDGYGNGVYGTPKQGGLVSRGSLSSSHPPPSLEDLKRWLIKFIGEDGATRMVNVQDCRDAYDVLARVLKKFGKAPGSNAYTPTQGQELSYEEQQEAEQSGELYGVFATSNDGYVKCLTDDELLAICHAPQSHDPLRERGLTLGRLNSRSEFGRHLPRRPKPEAFYGGGNGVGYSGSPSKDVLDEAAGHVTTAGKKVNRASTISIMSGLGVVTGKVGRSAAAGAQAAGLKAAKAAGAETSKSPSSVIPKRARNFFGQRPPSELISSHLADYFPATEKRVLERTARRSIYGRPSSSIRSKRESTWSFNADPDAPPLPRKENMPMPRGGAMFENPREAPTIHIGFEPSPAPTTAHGDQYDEDDDEMQGGGPPMLPPVSRQSLDDWTISLQTVGSLSEEGSPHLDAIGPYKMSRPKSTRRASGESARSRKSLATQLRAARGIGGPGRPGSIMADRSETASMLTVDEITQEVENRRESMSLAGSGGGWVVDEDGVPIPAPTGGSTVASTRPGSALSDLQDDDSETDPDFDPLAARGGGRDSPGAVSVRTKASRRAPPSRASLHPPAPTDESEGGVDSGAVRRSVTSRASSVSELRHGLHSDEDEGEDEDDDEEEEGEVGLGVGAMDTDEDDYDEDEYTDDDDDDEGGGVYKSDNVAPGKEPIKWIKGALIGAGSFGNVFLGMNARNGLLMAVKQVELPSGDSHNDQRKKSMLEALEREIELLKTLQHENIVQYLDSYADGTHLNIFLEYVPGGSVVAVLRNYGAFEEPLVKIFVKQILQGLSFLHNRDIVHRDIKGANILVDNKGCVKISDFGISKKVESDLLVSARAHRPSLQGSVYWMAPEVVKQTSYTRKADIWSLGCLVVEMISGTHPWANLNQMQALFKIGSSAKPALPDEISAECVDFLNKTFELDHNARPSADELLQHPFIVGEYTGPVGGGGAGAGVGGAGMGNAGGRDDASSAGGVGGGSTMGGTSMGGSTLASSSYGGGGGSTAGGTSTANASTTTLASSHNGAGTANASAGGTGGAGGGATPSTVRSKKGNAAAAAARKAAKEAGREAAAAAAKEAAGANGGGEGATGATPSANGGGGNS